MMCSIWGSRSVPSGLVGSGRSPAARRTVVVVVLSAADDADEDELDVLEPFDEHALMATEAAPAPRPVRNVLRESTTRVSTRRSRSAAAFGASWLRTMPFLAGHARSEM